MQLLFVFIRQDQLQPAGKNSLLIHVLQMCRCGSIDVTAMTAWAHDFNMNVRKYTRNIFKNLLEKNSNINLGLKYFALELDTPTLGTGQGG